MFQHPWSIRVEDACDARIDFVLTVVIHHQGFGDALAFVITRPESDWIYVSPIGLSLRMFQRVAINFGRRSLKNARADTLRQSEHVDHAHDARLHGLYRIVLVVNW